MRLHVFMVSAITGKYLICSFSKFHHSTANETYFQTWQLSLYC